MWGRSLVSNILTVNRLTRNMWFRILDMETHNQLEIAKCHIFQLWHTVNLLHLLVMLQIIMNVVLSIGVGPPAGCVSMCFIYWISAVLIKPFRDTTFNAIMYSCSYRESQARSQDLIALPYHVQPFSRTKHARVKLGLKSPPHCLNVCHSCSYKVRSNQICIRYRVTA